LYAEIGYTVFVVVLLLVLGVGNMVAILLVLFVPGYVLVAALFPKNTEIDWIERIALSFVLSFAVVSLLGLLVNFTPFGIGLVPIVVAIALFTVGVGTVAYWRRMRVPTEQRLSLTLRVSLPEWTKYSALEKGLTIALCGSVLIAGAALAHVVLAPRPGETFTEFYILGPGGNASGYPTVLNISQPGSVILGIANHETAKVNYTVRIDLVGLRTLYNATSGFNETVQTNRTTQSTFNVTLADGRNWTQPYTFSIAYLGLWKLQFLLFRDGGFSSAYRELHLFIRVS